jgi:hypothetical protein
MSPLARILSTIVRAKYGFQPSSPGRREAA